MLKIRKATKTRAKAKIAIIGVAGAGKTYTSLLTAQVLGKKILVIDTENGSADKYAAPDKFEFDIAQLEDYSLKSYIEALEYAAQRDYDVVIIDSLSHAWSGKGGALEQVEVAGRKFGGNKFAGWSEVTPLQNRLVDIILRFPTHLIATMRMKQEYSLIQDGKGKSRPQKIGLGIVQRDSLEYEFDIVAQMDTYHNIKIVKTRCFELDGFEQNKPDNTMGQMIKSWLSDGEPAPVFPKGWYPTKAEFFAKAVSEFNQSSAELAAILRSNGFDSYDDKKVVEMWTALMDSGSDDKKAVQRWPALVQATKEENKG